ncbi:MAG: hypothetical protein KGI04_00195 [Candidatus Micrarchaeota archaeon]|nr:hypothetical protein [Candidatus Micrarchaeota archaeon]
MVTHSKTGETEQIERSTKSVKRGRKEDVPVLNSLEELQELPISVAKAKEEGSYFLRWKNPDGSLGGFHADSRIANDVFIDPSAVVVDSKVRPGTKIGAKSIIYSSTIGRNNAIGSGCEIRDTESGDKLVMGDNCYVCSRVTADSDHEDEGVVIGDDVVVGQGVEITNAFIGKKVSIGAESLIEGFNHVYLGDRVKIGAKVKVEDDCAIQQDSTVPDGAKVLRHTILDNFKVPKGSIEEAAVFKMDVRK